MNSRVFISYTSRDADISDATLTQAKLLFSSFSEVFVDRLAPKPRYHPQIRIMWNVFRSHLLVIIESRSVYKSFWVILELLLAKLTLTPIIRLPVAILNRYGETQHTKD